MTVSNRDTEAGIVTEGIEGGPTEITTRDKRFHLIIKIPTFNREDKLKKFARTTLKRPRSWTVSWKEK
jgi:hypothetical protein